MGSAPLDFPHHQASSLADTNTLTLAPILRPPFLPFLLSISLQRLCRPRYAQRRPATDAAPSGTQPARTAGYPPSLWNSVQLTP